MDILQNSKAPVVFISYSWTTSEHENWVYELAERLRASDGIDVKLDKWDLKEGYDKYAFMERMVTSPEIDKVLVICDKGYQEKANDNRGGVGTEKLLITPEVMENVEQNKIIPIIAERDENGNAYMPTFLKSRIYIDMSDIETYEDNYDKLIRILLNAPLYRKPPLGKRRVFEDQESVNYYKSNNILRQMHKAADTNPQKLKSLAVTFVDNFFEDLEQLSINHSDLDKNEPDEKVIEKINASLPLRDSFIETVKLLSDNEQIDIEWIVDFFERIYSFTEFRDQGVFNKLQFDQYKFLITELLLYTCAVLFNGVKYKLLSELISTIFFFETKNGPREGGITYLRFYLRSLEYRNERLNLRKVSLHAQILVERINNKFINKQVLLDTDLMLFYLTGLIKNRESLDRWFPVTYIYRPEEEQIKLLTKLKSKRRADIALELFGVRHIEELKRLIADYSHADDYRYRSGERIPDIRTYINPDEIGVNP